MSTKFLSSVLLYLGDLHVPELTIEFEFEIVTFFYMKITKNNFSLPKFTHQGFWTI